MLLLEKLLDGLDVSVEPFALCEARGANLEMGRCDTATLHYALTGIGRVRIGNNMEVAIAPHTVLIVPAQLSHRLEPKARYMSAVASVARRRPLAEDWQHIAVGEEGDSLMVACGSLIATYQQAQGLFDYMREPIVETLAEGDPIRRAFDSLLTEFSNPQPGTRTMTKALLQECLILLLRRHCVSGECRLPWLTALEDPRLGRSLTAMVDRPGDPHSVERFAEIAGMSRSVFAEHFAQAFGRGPMEFLKEIRLRRAAHLLRCTDMPIKALAQSIGYASRSSFTHAFKDLYGIAPADYRSGIPRSIEPRDAVADRGCA